MGASGAVLVGTVEVSDGQRQSSAVPLTFQIRQPAIEGSGTAGGGAGGCGAGAVMGLLGLVGMAAVLRLRR